MDFEAAEKAYLTANAESERLAAKGGATEPTTLLFENATGAYLDVQMDGLRTLKDEGWHTDRPGVVSVNGTGGWSAEELSLTACEDSSAVRLINKDGNEVEKGRPRRFVQSLTATRVAGHWKISDVDSTVVKAFDADSKCS